MRTKELLKFSVNTPIEDARKVIASVRRHRCFPILDENGKYCGVVNRHNLLNLHRKRLILVDHNEERQQAGRPGKPIFWRSSRPSPHRQFGDYRASLLRNVPVGCTATIFVPDVRRAGRSPSKEIAGLLLSAICPTR